MQNSKINETEIRRIIKDELVKIFTADPDSEPAKTILEGIRKSTIAEINEERHQEGDNPYQF